MTALPPEQNNRRLFLPSISEVRVGGATWAIGRRPRSHQLHLVYDPKRVVVEKAEVYGPAVAGHAVAAVEGAGEEHVLGADEDGGLFGVEVPVALGGGEVFASHKDDGAFEG